MTVEGLMASLLNALARRPRVRRSTRGIVLGRVVDDPSHPIVWSDTRRPEHLACVGKTGTGKTTALEGWALQLMERGDPFVFFDYHGDATEHLLALAATQPGARDRVVLIDPTDHTSSPGLNPLERLTADEQTTFSRASELAAVLHRRWRVDAFGARTEELLRNTLFVLAAADHTLVDAPRFLTDPDVRRRLLTHVTNADILDYWHQRYEPLSEPMKATFREALLNKITGFLTDPACRHLLGQPTSTIDLGRAMNDGSWVLINLAKGRLGEHAHTLGNLIFAKLQFEVLARTHQPERERRLVTIFADEVQNLAENSNDLITLLAEGRKFAVSVATAGQFWDQIPRDLRGALLSVGTHVFFRLSSADSAVLAGELSVTNRHRYHRELTELPRGRALVRVGIDAPVSVIVPPLPKITGATRLVRDLRTSSLARCARPRADIEADIQARRRVPADVPPTLPHLHDEHDHGQTGW